MKRSRLAFAMSITLAALPILVLDNLPATAEAEGDRVEAVAASETSDAPPSTTATSAPSSSTTAAPTTTTAAPTTTTEAPTTTEEVEVVQALAAPAPTTPPPTVAPPTTQPPTTTTPPPTAGDPNDPATWERLAQCESGGNWAMSTGNGYYGGLQFSLATWQNVGGAGYPHHATKAEQIKRGQILQARAGWGQWPYCSRKLGYR